MKARRNFFLIVAAVLAMGFSVLFATVLQEWFRMAILAPLMRGFFLIRFYTLRLPQQLWWVAFLLLTGALLVRMALRALGPAPKRSQRRQATGETVDELEWLASTINHAQHRSFHQKQVVNELAKITARLIARHEQIRIDDAQRCLGAGTWGDDPVAQAFFRTDKKKRRRRARRTDRFNEQLRHTVHILERYSQGGC